MLGLSSAQPAVSALVEGVCRGLPWPSTSPLRPDLAGQWVALHGTLAWSAAQAQAAARMGLRDCPRGRVVGVGQIACWARMPEDGGEVHHFGPLPRWASSIAALIDFWPPAPGRCAVFFDEVVPATGDDPRLVDMGNAAEPWRVSRETEAVLRALVAPPPAGAFEQMPARPAPPRVDAPDPPPATRPAGPRPVTAAPATGGPGAHRRRPPTEEARRIEQRLAGLIPAEWSLDVDGETVGVRDARGNGIRSFVRLLDRATFANELVRVAHRSRAANTDSLVGQIRRAQPYEEAR